MYIFNLFISVQSLCNVLRSTIVSLFIIIINFVISPSRCSLVLMPVKHFVIACYDYYSISSFIFLYNLHCCINILIVIIYLFNT